MCVFYFRLRSRECSGKPTQLAVHFNQSNSYKRRSLQWQKVQEIDMYQEIQIHDENETIQALTVSATWDIVELKNILVPIKVAIAAGIAVTSGR